MECQPLTVYCRVRKVEKKTGRILATTYTKMVDKNGNPPHAEDVYNEKYAHKETPDIAYLVFECSEAEHKTKKQIPVKKREHKFMVEDVYEEIRIAEYTKDYSAICDLLTNLSPKTLQIYFTP